VLRHGDFQNSDDTIGAKATDADGGASNTGTANPRSRSPASVSPTLRVVREKRGALIRSSRTRIAWLTAEGVTPRRREAARKPRSSATAKNVIRPSRCVRSI